MLNSEKIKARMVELGLTQRDIAAMLGINVSTLNRKLNDETGAALRISEADKLISILKITDIDAYFFSNMVAQKQPKAENKKRGGAGRI